MQVSSAVSVSAVADSAGAALSVGSLMRSRYHHYFIASMQCNNEIMK
jgi:hypothetical protein